MKRTDYISWDEYFMGIALLSAQRSKDNNTQVGACIVSEDNKILSVGYNGMPIGCDDDKMPWERTGERLDTKYPFVCQTKTKTIINNPTPATSTAKSTKIPSFRRFAAGKRQETKSLFANRKFAHRKSTTTVWQYFRKHLSDTIFLIRFTAEYGRPSKYNPPSVK